MSNSLDPDHAQPKYLQRLSAQDHRQRVKHLLTEQIIHPV